MYWLLIALNDIKISLKDKGALFWAFVAPVIFVSFFGTIFKEPVYKHPKVAIVNRDKTNLIADSLNILLTKNNIDIIKNYENKKVPLIIIPDGTTDKILSNQKAQIELHAKEESFQNILILIKLANALTELSLCIDTEYFKKNINNDELEKLFSIKSTINLNEKKLSNYIQPISYGFQRSLPACLVMLIFINLFTYSAAYLVYERELGFTRRLQLAPMNPYHIVIGKITSRVIWNMIQIIFLIVLGILLFNINLGNDIIALIILLFSFAVSSAAMGIYFSSLFKNPNKCAGIGIMIILIMSALGGCWWPLEIVPEYLRYVAYIIPTGWAMDGLTKIMSFGSFLPDVLPNISAFLVTSILFIYLASHKFFNK